MQTLRILIADDHQLFSSGLKLLLMDLIGIGEPDHATNGRDAISMCDENTYDVILMDINMPIIDGAEATRQIKKKHPGTKIIIVSMLSDYESIANVLKAGADGFLLKNADASEFINAFEAISQKKIYLSPSLEELFSKNDDRKITRKNFIQFAENIVTPREKSILKLIAEGQTNHDIATTLFLSVKTVETHRNNMLAKLNLPNTAALVKFAFDNKLL